MMLTPREITILPKYRAALILSIFSDFTLQVWKTKKDTNKQNFDFLNPHLAVWDTNGYLAFDKIKRNAIVIVAPICCFVLFSALQIGCRSRVCLHGQRSVVRSRGWWKWQPRTSRGWAARWRWWTLANRRLEFRARSWCLDIKCYHLNLSAHWLDNVVW